MLSQTREGETPALSILIVKRMCLPGPQPSPPCPLSQTRNPSGRVLGEGEMPDRKAQANCNLKSQIRLLAILRAFH